MPKGNDFASADAKMKGLLSKLRELRDEKTTLTESFTAGRIPQDIYKKTIIRIQQDISRVEKEAKRLQGT